jgi:hypothetical protein
VILFRPHETGLTRATKRALRRPGVLARADGFVIYRTRPE